MYVSNRSGPIPSSLPNPYSSALMLARKDTAPGDSFVDESAQPLAADGLDDVVEDTKRSTTTSSSSSTATLAPYTDVNEDDDEIVAGEDDDEVGGRARLSRLKRGADIKKEEKKKERRANEIRDLQEGSGDARLRAAAAVASSSSSNGTGAGHRVDDTPAQPPFQPSATDGKRRFLVWNTVGSMVSREEATHSQIELQFADSTRHRKAMIRDHFNFTLGALGENACFLGARSVDASKMPIPEPEEEDDDGTGIKKPKEDKAQPENSRPSVIAWRPHISATWAGNSEWTIRLPGNEEVECLAIGGNWGAVATNQQWVRIFSYSGTQRYMFSLPGPVVTMVGNGAVLAVIYHASAPHFQSQNLAVIILDIDSRRRLHEGPVPLTPQSFMTWIGFTDLGMLVTMDSDGIIRGMSRQWDLTWTPLLLTSNERKHSSDTFWPVGIIDDKLVCVTLKGGIEQPNPLPKPVLNHVTLRMPLIHHDKLSGPEEKWVRDGIMNMRHRWVHLMVNDVLT
jgi:hypothetical protein